MKVVRKDIVKDMLNTQFAFATKKDKADKLIKRIIDEENPDIIEFDLSNATIDHYFCEAFGWIYDMSFDSAREVDIVFILHDYQLHNVLKGLLAYKRITYSNVTDGNLLDFFKLNMPAIKVLMDKTLGLEFISNMNSLSKAVLGYVNEQRAATSLSIMQNTGECPMEDLVPLLDDLVQKRLIYRDLNKNYNSVSSFLIHDHERIIQ